MNVRETSLSHPPTFSSTHSPVQLPVVAYVSVLFWLPSATYALQVLPRKPTIFLSSFEPLVLNCTQVEIQRLVGSPKSCLDFEDFIRQRVHEVPSLQNLQSGIGQSSFSATNRKAQGGTSQYKDKEIRKALIEGQQYCWLLTFGCDFVVFDTDVEPDAAPFFRMV